MTDVTEAPPLAATAHASGLDAHALERELAKLWDGVSAEARARGAVAMRSSVLNLVVYEPDADADSRVQETLAALATLHPARSIVVQVAPETQPAALDASIGVMCRLGNGAAQHFCHEQIAIRARSAALRQVPGIVIPLLRRQLPTALWWVGDLPDDLREVRRACAFSDTLIVDSYEFADGAAGIRHLYALRRVLPPEIDLADLNWTRTAHWRELIAQAFDAADCRRYLRRLHRVRIELGRGADGTVAARGRTMMLIAWLATRLGWRSTGAVDFSQGVGWSLRFRSRAVDRVEVEIAVMPEDEGGLSGLRAIELAGRDEAGEASFRIERADDRVVGHCRFTLPGQAEQTRITGMQFPSQAELLAEELMQPARDEVFEAALAYAAPLIATGEVTP